MPFNKSSSTNFEFLIKDHFQTNGTNSGHSKIKFENQIQIDDF